MKKALDICSFVLLLLCVVAILVCGVLLVENNSGQTIVKHEIQLAVVPDSLGILPRDVHIVVDTLQTYIHLTEQRMADKYEYFLEQKKEENVLFSVGSLFGGIFISILGFFGYKSFKDIEAKAEKQAGNIVAETAEEHLKNNLPKYVSNEFPRITNNLTDTVCVKVQENIRSEISNSIEKVREDIDLLYMYIDEKNESKTKHNSNDNDKQNDMDDLFW